MLEAVGLTDFALPFLPAVKCRRPYTRRNYQTVAMLTCEINAMISFVHGWKQHQAVLCHCCRSVPIFLVAMKTTFETFRGKKAKCRFIYL